MEALRQWYAWLYRKAVCMARVALGRGHGELGRYTGGLRD
jgi:hypothetical protein